MPGPQILRFSGTQRYIYITIHEQGDMGNVKLEWLFFPGIWYGVDMFSEDPPSTEDWLLPGNYNTYY